jgi:type IV secretory pathway protease TraF
LITGNVSPSAPVGVYIRSAPNSAEYVTFCLAERHSTQVFFDRFCSPAAPNKIKILKRISERQTNGSLVVQGIAPGSIDSSLIGLVQPAQVYGYWRHVSL